MYATSTASTTSGSGRSGHRGGSTGAGDRRVRVVRLLRPRRDRPAFGFSLRGGKEYATGFFVSKVEFNSEAHMQGLKVGDQLISVNGYRVDDAVHSELVHYLATQARLKIKVRHVGMVPVKDKSHEPLTWHFVSERVSLASDVSSSPTLCHDTERMNDLRLSILVPPRAKLGCGICKGPEWKPGIFVQFVREGGIAREAGLRPGDQILACNGQDFANVSFNDAISAMKVCGRLELLIREGAGLELVSPESSGYNSSASSAAGERSPAPAATIASLAPPAALRRRLASVAEEAADRADRLTMNRLKRRTWDSLDFDWKTGDIHNFDAPSDIEPDYDCPSIPNNPHSYEAKTSKTKKDFITAPSNRTIINLTEDGATIQCSYDNPSPRKGNQIESDKKTIVVEVHHTSNTTCGKQHFPPPKEADSSSLSSTNTLSSAIAEEIQRRKLNKKNSTNSEKTPPDPPKKPVVKPVDNVMKKQHDALMDEFKKVHRKMFMNQDTKEDTQNEKEGDADSLDRQQTLPLRKADPPSEPITNGKALKIANSHNPTKETNGHTPGKTSNGFTPAVTSNGHTPNKTSNGLTPNKTSNGFNPASSSNFPAVTSNGHTPTKTQNGYTPSKGTNGANGVTPVKTNGYVPPKIANGYVAKRDSDNPPPPPPMPMPTTNGHINGEHKNGDDQKPLLKKTNSDFLINGSPRKNGTLLRTPTPDYGNGKPDPPVIKMNTMTGDKVELDSLESFKLKNPSNTTPKPPANYFMTAPNGTSTMKKLGRPVSVTIGEYSSHSGRREPSKLDFLNGDKPDGPTHVQDDGSLSNRLQSELAHTLSRSNLRKKTEALDVIKLRKDYKLEESDGSIDRNFHARYGNNLLPLPPSISIPKIYKIKH